jgi:hypothetical protein
MSFERPLSSEGGVAGRDAASIAALSTARDVLKGHSDALSPSDAIQLIAESAFPNKHRDLQLVLADEAAPARLRYLAAVALARCDRPAALEILIGASGESHLLVLAGVLRALGQIGDEPALRAVERALPRAEGRARSQGEFARMLITHRLGLADRGAAPADTGELLDLSPDAGQRIVIRRARPHVATRALVSLGPRPYGIELAEDPMFELTCGRCRGTIMVNREFARPDALAALRARPALFGIATLAGRLRDDFSAAALVLTTPEANGSRIRIAIHLTNGERVFAGVAEVRDDAARWTLRAVRRLGAFPIRAEGRFSSGVVHIDDAAFTRRVIRSARPTAITAPSAPRVVQLRPPSGDA